MDDLSPTDTPPPPAHPLRKAFHAALQNAARRRSRKLEKLAREQDDAGEAEAVREAGEILKAHHAEVPRGAEAVELPDLYHPGRTRRIELDPALGAMANARRYFKRYGKLSRSLEHKRREAERAGTELAAIEELQGRYAAWDEAAPPQTPPPGEMLQEAEALRVQLPWHQTEGEILGKDAPPPGTRRFVSHDGYAILVGKAAGDNDRLSFDIARGNDWWFHVAGTPGSHVLVRGNMLHRSAHGRKHHALPQETLLDAAHLAVHFSKQRGARRAEVTCCQAKNLRKGKRAPAGEVTVCNGKTLALRLQPARLGRLLRPEGRTP